MIVIEVQLHAHTGLDLAFILSTIFAFMAIHSSSMPLTASAGTDMSTMLVTSDFRRDFLLIYIQAAGTIAAVMFLAPGKNPNLLMFPVRAIPPGQTPSEVRFLS